MEIDRVKILYGVGVVLGVATVFHFGFELLDDLSPTTTAAVLLLGFTAFLAAGLYTEAETLDTVFYALAAGSYLVFVFYTGSTFDLGDVGLFLILGVSSALFVALGYALSKDGFEVERRYAAVGIVVAVIVGVALLGFDVLGAQPTYDEEFVGELDVPDIDGEAVVGELTASNGFVLSRHADPPNFGTCLYTPEREATRLSYSETTRSLILSGGESRTFELTMRGHIFYEREDGEERLRGELRADEPVPVEVADECPDEADGPRLVVVRGGVVPPR